MKQFHSNNQIRPLGNLEGIDLTNDISFIERHSLIDRLLNAGLTKQSILIRSPPCTGKTSLSQLIYRKLYENQSCLPISITMLAWEPHLSFEDGFAEYSGLGKSWQEMIKSFKSSKHLFVLIIDEAQTLYSHIRTELWKQIKNGLPIHIIFISAYGESVQNTNITTPFEFEQDQIFGLEYLLFSRQEFQEFIERGFLHIQQFPNIQEMIYCATNGHIGMMKKIEQVFYNYRKTKIQQGSCIEDIWQESTIKQLIIGFGQFGFGDSK